MCRLFGLVSTSEVDIRYWMLDAVRPFVGWSDVHCHAWGIAGYHDGAVFFEKEPIPAKDSRLFQETAKSARSRLFVGHLRKATVGRQIFENAQPFVSGNWVFAHNGGLARRYLLPKLDNAQTLIKGETDSEVYFHWLLKNLKVPGVDGLRLALHEIRKRKFTALNFVLSDGQTLYAYWEKMSHAIVPYKDYYQLYYSRRSNPDGVVVCSERLDDIEWLKLPERSLLTVSAELETRVISV